VAIARALAHDPGIILADEPTAALDSKSGRAVTELLCRLAHDEGRIVVIVTHDARVESFADRIVTIEDGLLLEDFVPAQRAADGAATARPAPTDFAERVSP
jgi:putative ABC transport system ATP-binding protein